MTIEISGAAALLNTLRAGAAASTQSPAAGAAGAETPMSFGDALTRSIDRIDALKRDAIDAGQAYERGVPGIGLNNVMVDMAKADVATTLGIQVRNRVVSAYQDIMNMQV